MLHEYKDQWDSESYYLYGTLYENGFYVTQDYQEAFRAYQNSAEVSESELKPMKMLACQKLGFFYGRGVGVKQDLKLSETWYREALRMEALIRGAEISESGMRRKFKLMSHAAEAPAPATVTDTRSVDDLLEYIEGGPKKDRPKGIGSGRTGQKKDKKREAGASSVDVGAPTPNQSLPSIGTRSEAAAAAGKADALPEELAGPQENADAGRAAESIVVFATALSQETAAAVPPIVSAQLSETPLESKIRPILSTPDKESPFPDFYALQPELQVKFPLLDELFYYQTRLYDWGDFLRLCQSLNIGIEPTGGSCYLFLDPMSGWRKTFDKPHRPGEHNIPISHGMLSDVRGFIWDVYHQREARIKGPAAAAAVSASAVSKGGEAPTKHNPKGRGKKGK